MMGWQACEHVHIPTHDHSAVIITLSHEYSVLWPGPHPSLNSPLVYSHEYMYQKLHDCMSHGSDAIMLGMSAHRQTDRHGEISKDWDLKMALAFATEQLHCLTERHKLQPNVYIKSYR